MDLWPALRAIIRREQAAAERLLRTAPASVDASTITLRVMLGCLQCLVASVSLPDLVRSQSADIAQELTLFLHDGFPDVIHEAACAVYHGLMRIDSDAVWWTLIAISGLAADWEAKHLQPITWASIRDLALLRSNLALSVPASYPSVRAVTSTTSAQYTMTPDGNVNAEISPSPRSSLLMGPESLNRVESGSIVSAHPSKLQVPSLSVTVTDDMGHGNRSGPVDAATRKRNAYYRLAYGLLIACEQQPELAAGLLS